MHVCMHVCMHVYIHVCMHACILERESDRTREERKEPLGVGQGGNLCGTLWHVTSFPWSICDVPQRIISHLWGTHTRHPCKAYIRRTYTWGLCDAPQRIHTSQAYIRHTYASGICDVLQRIISHTSGDPYKECIHIRHDLACIHVKNIGWLYVLHTRHAP